MSHHHAHRRIRVHDRKRSKLRSWYMRSLRGSMVGAHSAMLYLGHASIPVGLATAVTVLWMLEEIAELAATRKA